MSTNNVEYLGSKLVLLNGLPMTLPVAASDPGSAVAGDMYYNSTSNTVRVYNGSAFNSLDSSGLISQPLALDHVIIGNSSNLSVAVDSSALGDILADPSTGLTIKAGVITNSEINASAAIAYSKLALTGDIVNADISAAAAIAYSKLALTSSIVNADISASAAIAYSKLSLAASVQASDMNSGAAASGLVLTANGTGGATYTSVSAGTVTSVAVTVPSFLTVSGSPITSSGTIAISATSEAANTVLAAPNGSAGAMSPRLLVAADIPSLSATYELVSNFASRSYQGSLSLPASTSSATAISGLSFAVASYGAVSLDYVIIESSTNSRRMGRFKVATDGTNIGFADEYAESATLGTGIVLSAVLSAGNILIEFSGTNTNACTMRCEVIAFAA